MKRPAFAVERRQEVDPEDDLVELAASCAFMTKRWSRLAWDWGVGALLKWLGPKVWQDDILGIIEDHLLNDATRFQPLQIAVASGHGIGKSALMGIISNWAMSCWEDAMIVTTANTDTQLRTKTAPEIGKWFRTSITAHWFNVQATSIKAKDPVRSEKWRQDFIPWSEHNTEAFAGLHNEGKIVVLLFDEASKIADKVWEVAEGAMTDEDTVIIWIVFGNPTRNSGRFRECFRRFRDFWIRRQIDSRTVEGTNKAFLDRLATQYGVDSDQFKIRVRGEFPSQSAMQLISQDDIDAAAKRHLRPEQYKFAPKIIGVDPAWSGEDALEIYLRQGLYSKHLLTLPKNDNDVAVALKIAALEDEYEADAVFVDGGYGTGIVSVGRTWGRDWRIVWFGGGATDPGYLNKRAEMWGKGVKGWLKDGGAIDPADLDLQQDLSGPETVPRTDGKIQLESKQDMKERGLPSPNKGDALAITFAEPVTKRPVYPYFGKTDTGRGVDGGNHHTVQTDYDPLAL